MARYVEVHHEDGRPLPLQVRVCDTFLCRLRGLTFRRALSPGEALLFVEPRASRAGTAIHMFFVFFPIAVLWLAEDGEVVDTCLARPFRPYYAPQKPARYFLECAPELLEQVEVGEHLSIPGVI